LHPGDILSAERMAQHLRQAGVGRQGDRIVAVSVHHGSTDQPIGAVAQQLLSGAQ
jgi:hypothetical protein